MFESEIVLGLVIGAWILYELYGKNTMEWLSAWSGYIRIAGGIVVIAYLYWQMKDNPADFQTTLVAAKDLLLHNPITKSAKTEKRNVSALLKKKVAASQEWKCGSCSNTLDETYEVDHKLALFQGGSNEASNLIALCPHCHRKKTVEERLG